MKDYTRHAIWMLVAYQVFFSVLVLISLNSLWVAIDFSFKTNQYQERIIKLPCSSEIDNRCEIYND